MVLRIVVIVKCMLIKLWFVLRWIVKLWWEVFVNYVEKWELLWLWMEKDDSWGKGYVCDRESWAGRIATRKCEMVRLSRVNSLIGGHLYWEMWNDMRKEMKWYDKRNEMWGNVRLSHPILIWNDCCDWNWLMACINDWIVNYFDWEIVWLVLNSDWSCWYS